MVEALYYTLWATYLLVIVDKKKKISEHETDSGNRN